MKNYGVPMKQSHSKPRLSLRNKRGSVMIVSLAILALLTVAAAFSMQRTTLQVRMINNMDYKRQISTTTFTYIEWMMAHLNDPQTQTGVLSTMISTAKADENAGLDTSATAISIYDEYNWSTPALPNMKAVVSVTDEITVEALPVTSSLKTNEGNSPGAQAPYFFRAVFTGRDNSGNITTTMEQGFIKYGPAS